MDSYDFVIVGVRRAGCVLATDRTMRSCFHPAGTCRMEADAMSVVDPAADAPHHRAPDRLRPACQQRTRRA